MNTVAAPTPTPGGGSVGGAGRSAGGRLGGNGLRRVTEAEVARRPPPGVGSHARPPGRTARAADGNRRSRPPELRSRHARFQAAQIHGGGASRPRPAIEEASKQASWCPWKRRNWRRRSRASSRAWRELPCRKPRRTEAWRSNLAETARRGGIENVRANLPGVRDESWLRDIEERLKAIGARDRSPGIRHKRSCFPLSRAASSYECGTKNKWPQIPNPVGDPVNPHCVKSALSDGH